MQPRLLRFLRTEVLLLDLVSSPFGVTALAVAHRVPLHLHAGRETEARLSRLTCQGPTLDLEVSSKTQRAQGSGADHGSHERSVRLGMGEEARRQAVHFLYEPRSLPFIQLYFLLASSQRNPII